jgi:hypothetical protein
MPRPLSRRSGNRRPGSSRWWWRGRRRPRPWRCRGPRRRGGAGAFVGAADIHAGAAAHGLQAFEDLDVYVKVEQDVTYVIRARAEINGRRVVMAQYFLPADHWDTEKQQQAQVLSTFELTHPIEENVEAMTKYHFLDIAEFQYPESWQFRTAPLKNAERLTFQLFNVESEKTVDWKHYKTLNGRIEIHIVSTDVSEGLDAELDNLKDQLSKLKLAAGQEVEVRNDIKFGKGIDPSPTHVYDVKDTEGGLLQYEYWVTALEAGGYYYFFTLVTPSRDEDFFIWSRNWQTYRVIIESLKTLDESLISR